MADQEPVDEFPAAPESADIEAEDLADADEGFDDGELERGGEGDDAEDAMEDPGPGEELPDDMEAAGTSGDAGFVGAGFAGKGAEFHQDGDDGDGDEDDSEWDEEDTRGGEPLRGVSNARPDSAAIADAIEGFHDDYLEIVANAQTKAEAVEQEKETEEAEVREEEAAGPDISDMLELARAEQAQLLEVNERLQRHIRSALDLRRKTQDGEDNKLGTAEARYMSLRKTLVEQHAKLQATEQHYDTVVLELRDLLQERLAKSSSISQALRHFIVEVGKGSENSKTGKVLSEKVVLKLDSLDRAKEVELQKLRLQNIDLTNRLARLEQSLKEKEEMAEGLHLIDFEQLKIENQSLNEKIEERNEELLKLKKKITTTVQILTHMREKLQFVMRGNHVLAREVSELEADLAGKRASLSKVKSHRDKLRLQARRIRENSVYIGNPTLLDDMQAQIRSRDAAQSDIEDLQETHADMLRQVAETTHRIIGITQDMKLSGSSAGGVPVKRQLSHASRSQSVVRV